MKAKPCELIVNTRWTGHICQPMKFPSIAEAVRWAKGGNGGFWYRIYVDGKKVRQGYCKDN